ncbi:hypothetical protein GON26_10955 [Flavobacterium sp. GA093]|uniref:3-keto-disaccharide hydrolase domain-containing protein n=1 Tax=Flavobacterium hydrocarbonoxydans TaxID=2683249 RepID=A0A6I4NUW8_9FLAO|nr:hypothetical protein [Flavobacterium hydrocarbonoxydans]MWB94887.1 hypothetical protein [Flavobacterium hydrocarbonoxydans]
MKLKNIIFLAGFLTLLSCSNLIVTSNKTYQLEKVSKLQSHWDFEPEKWFLEKDTLTGKGGPLRWSIIESKKLLPKNYEITLKANMTKESLFEIMLNLNQEKYIRTYLYQIDQNIVIGKGVYKKGGHEYENYGGPSLFTKSMKLEKNKWYFIKIKMLHNQLFFSVDNETVLTCYIDKNNLNEEGKLGFITNGEVKITNLTIRNITEKR